MKNKLYYLLPLLFILMLFSCVQPPTTPEAPTNLTPDGTPLRISSVNPTTFTNDKDSRVTITGTGFINSTAFFVQSTKLEIASLTRTQAIVIVPKRFLPSVYGIMVADNTGSRATLYPAFTISQAASTRAIDEEINYLSFVEGYVIDHDTQQPIQDATVGISGLETNTNSSGYYLLRGVPTGRQALEIKKTGYEPLYRIAEVPVSSNGQTLTMKLSELEPKSTRVTMIGSSGGTHFASADGEAGPFLKIPAGALEKETPIQFTHLRTANTLPELPQDGYYLAFAHLGPTGLVFKKPATLFLPLQAGVEMPVGTPINISYFDAREAKWVDDITNGKISRVNGKLFLEYEINHFTWIGGQAPSDSVSFSIQDQNGNPLPRVTTNFGVTNAAGTVFGTIPRFSSEPVTVKPITPSNMNCTTPNSPTRVSGTPVNFIDPVVCNVNAPLVSSPTPERQNQCDGSQPVAPSGASNSLARSSSGARPQAVPTDASRVLLIAKDTFGFTTTLENFKSGGSDASKTKLMVGNVDMTQKARFRTLENDSVEVSVKFREVLKAQANLEIKLETTKWGGDKVESKVSADVVAKIRVPNINFIQSEDFIQDSQAPYFESDENEINIVFKSSNVGQSIDGEINPYLTDEKGNSLAVSTNYRIRIDGSESWFIGSEGSVRIFIPELQTLNRIKAETQTIFIEPVIDNNSQGLRAAALPVSNICITQKLFDFSDVSLSAPNLTNLYPDLIFESAIPNGRSFQDAIDDEIKLTRECLWKADCRTVTKGIFQPNRFVPPLATSPEFFGPTGIRTRDGDEAVNAGEVVRSYGERDWLERSTGIKAVITRNMIGKGSAARPTPEVTGWQPVLNGVDQGRGHLLANILGGSGKIPNNLTPIIQNPVNNPCMRDLEMAVAAIVNAIPPIVTGSVVYSAKPVYIGNSVVPSGIIVRAYWIESVTAIPNGPNGGIVRSEVDGFDIFIRNTTDRANVMRITRTPASGRIPARVLICG